jgi:NTE family protein
MRRGRGALPSPVAGPLPVRTAWVLGGGGVHGAVEVGMLRALVERGLRPDLVLGTSVGALNGALYAADPDSAVERLTALWMDFESHSPFEGSLIEQAGTIARNWTHLHGNHRLRRLILQQLPVRTFEELEIPFACVAASIEDAGARWFDHGDLIEPLLASTAVPGLLPPVEIDDRHHLDGGLVDPIPVDRAVELGATCIMVLQVGRIEQALAPPKRPWEVASVAFEIARRHRFNEVLAKLPPGVEVHVLPVGEEAGAPTGLAQLRYRSIGDVGERIEATYRASMAHLVALGIVGMGRGEDAPSC